MRNCNTPQKSTSKPPLVPVAQQSRLPLLLPGTSARSSGDVPVPSSSRAAQPSHPCRAWHLLREQVVLQRWPQTLLLLVPKGAGQDGCRTVLLVREFSAIKLPSTTLEQLTFRARGSIIIPSIHFCERTRAKPGLFTYKSIAIIMYYHSGDYQINNAGSLKLIFKQIYYFQKEEKKNT